MTEARGSVADAAKHDPAALQARIAAVRSVAARADPVRLKYVEALAARLELQGEPVRQLLCDKLAAAVALCEQRCAGLAPPPRRKSGAAACTPLAELNRHIGTVARGKAADPRIAAGADDLPSARRFRRAWLGGRTQEQVQQAARRKPANAGPLNSHALVLESLAMMSQLSPDYLRRFVGYVQALQRLEQASVDEMPSAPSATRGKKTSRAPRRK